MTKPEPASSAPETMAIKELTVLTAATPPAMYSTGNVSYTGLANMTVTSLNRLMLLNYTTYFLSLKPCQLCRQTGTAVVAQQSVNI